MIDKETTAPASEPVSTANAKAHLRVTHSSDDTYIDSLVVAARKWIEDTRGIQMITATRTLKMGWFGDVVIPRAPLASVVHVKYYDEDEVQQTVSSAVYTVDTDSTPGEVYLAYDQEWPTDVLDIPKAVEIQYTCGYGSAADVPAGLVHAVKLLVGHWYENREDSATVNLSRVPMAAQALVQNYGTTSIA